MPKKSDYDAKRLRHVLQAQHQVVTRVQALACGMPQSTLDRYIAPGGRWQRLLPGVYLAVTGAATQDQRELAALLYAGRRSLLTGSAAMRRHRLRPAGPDVVDVLIPWQRRRQSTGFVRVHRTRRMPVRLNVTGGIRFAKAPRAVADAARGLTRFDDVRQVVCEAVQRRACSVAELTEELEAGPPRSSALFREALAEVGDGVRSVAEADFRILILRSGLPRTGPPNGTTGWPPTGSSPCISRADGSRPTRPASSASSSRRSTRAWPGRGSRSRRFRRPRRPGHEH